MVFITGLAIGALLGAAAALLTAPQTGEDTRRLLSRQTRRLARRGREAWEDLGEELRHQRNMVKRRAASFL